MLPREALRVEALDESVGAVNLGAVAVGEGGPVVGFAPDEQAAGGMLLAVTVGGVALIFQAFADYVVADEIAEGLEAEDELALCRRHGGRHEEEES